MSKFKYEHMIEAIEAGWIQTVKETNKKKKKKLKRKRKNDK